ncbi:PAS domain S-box protein [Paenibacillus sp. KQZ6P-2]|uniref:histidine kinase n=1 Tax=Paenibacillus mangrovi TaxID=2931978 RepID=A0A9X1WUA6_9BACL|nr:HAMP domain-containing sensor histidine kinase [Paenibacillus mangrovi]MCJ8015189.1 PAS domain S-box protein [Paenibacillus mangrovi]
MSIKNKLTLIMSGSLLLILLLYILLSLYTTQANLKKDSESKMLITARQIATTIEQSQYSSDYVEKQLGEMLRMASILAAKELPDDYHDIDNRQLKKLSEEVGVTDISLMARTEDDIMIIKSSDPNELGMSTRDWGYWYKAFNQLFNMQEVTVSQGMYMDKFWTGPFEYSTSSPDYIDKWGYYYDGKRNYIINPYIRSNAINDYEKKVGPEAVLEKTKKVNKHILEITCINPQAFGNQGISATGFDSYNIQLRNRPIQYGTYTYKDAKDTKAVSQAIETGNSVVFDTKIHGKKVMKSFIPIFNPDQSVYIISIVMDYNAISQVLKGQLVNYIVISASLLIIIILGSYIVSGFIIRPIKSILVKVKDVSEGRFDTPLIINSKDELGLLSSKINSMTDSLSDYTNQLKEAVEENKSVKDHLESIIQQIADAIHTVDWSGRVLQVNKAFEELYGWKSHEIIGKKLKIVPDFLENEEAQNIQALRRGEQLPPTETLRLRRDGSLVEVSISTAPVKDEEGHITSFISVSRDMTERNKMDELLRRSEKLTTVGQLAAGVAHEIRNPLTTLRGFLQLQRETNRLSPQHNEIMLSELDRINLIVSEFLILAKPQAVQFQIKSIRSILNGVISLLDSQAHLFGIEFKFEFEPEDFKVHCEENQMKQVFINIIKNAIEAMEDGEDGGVITIELFQLNQEEIGITITDQGIGIPSDMMPKLGEPFFTSKEKGTGLGLMISQGIIEGHKGMLEIFSKPGKGTRVDIVLPLAGVRQQTYRYHHKEEEPIAD